MERKKSGMKKDSASITLRTVVCDFLAAKEKQLHPEYFSFLSIDKGSSMEMGEKSLQRKAKKEENNYILSKARRVVTD